MKGAIAALVLMLLLAGCTGPANNVPDNDPVCHNLLGEIRAQFGQGYDLAAGELEENGGSCLYESKTDLNSPVIALVHKNLISNKSKDETIESITTSGLYQLSTQKKIVEDDNYVYGYMAKRENTVLTQSLILFKGSTMIQISLIVFDESDLYSESMLLGFALRINEKVD